MHIGARSTIASHCNTLGATTTTTNTTQRQRIKKSIEAMSLQKLNSLENKVRALSDLAEEQAEERLTTSGDKVWSAIDQ